MKLIVGLGNPGKRFDWTRHNLGFLALDFYLKRYNGTWSEKPLLGAVKAELEHFLTAKGEKNIKNEGLPGGADKTTKEKVFFIKPQDFYNLSGQAVKAYARYYKINPQDILVICDNFDLKFGELRFRSKGSSGGNNGLKSIDKELGTTEYPRLRIGTENAELKARIGATDFVLSRFTPEEKEKLSEVLEKVCEKIDEFIWR